MLVKKKEIIFFLCVFVEVYAIQMYPLYEYAHYGGFTVHILHIAVQSLFFFEKTTEMVTIVYYSLKLVSLFLLKIEFEIVLMLKFITILRKNTKKHICVVKVCMFY